MKNLSFFLVLLFFTQTVFAAGKLQGADFKTEAELISAGATKAQLLPDTKMYVTANGVNDTLYNAISNGQIGGSGGSAGGVNLLANDSFEFGVATGWTSSGGTLSQQTYTNGKTGDTKYARFVSGTIGQYVESSAYARPDSLGAGCQADLDAHVTSGSWTYSVIDGSSNVLASGTIVVPNSSTWQRQQTLSMACPAAGVTIKVRVTSTATGTIEIDHMYLGGNKNLVNGFSVDTSWASCTPNAYQGIGTPTSVNIQCKRLGTDLLMKGSFVSGTSSASEARIGLPVWNGLQLTSSDSSVIPVLQMAGDLALGASSTTYFRNTLLIEPSVTYLTVGNQSSSVDSTTKATGTGGIGSTRTVFITARIPISGWESISPSTAITSDQSGWFVDVNIGGANPATTNVSSYTPWENSALDLVNNNTAVTVQIPCSSTNASTGLTCSTGNEQVGVVFTPPYAGWFDACLWAGGSNGAATTGTVEWVETSNTSQTILQEGNSRTGFSNSNTSDTIPMNNCGTFYFSSISQRTLRFSYEANSTAGSILADRSATFGQRDIHITVRPSTMNVARPVLSSDTVTAAGVSKPVVYEQEVTCGASSTIDAALGTTLFTAIGTQASGNCTFTIASGLFGATARTNSAPFCKCTTSTDTTTAAVFSMVFSSATAGTLFCNAGAGACASTVSTICECKGPKP